MPELPEVETVVRGLRHSIVGCVVENISFFREDVRDPIPTQELHKTFLGQTVSDVTRRAKYIVIECSKGAALVHLGMTGRLLISEVSESGLPHTHVSIRLRSNRGKEIFVHFVDPRRFGRIGCSSKDPWQEHPFMRDLGVEPLGAKDLGHILAAFGGKRRVPIKNLIMDGRVVVGVGNIYASEALFLAKIDPRRPSQSLDQHEYKSLAMAIREVLQDAIRAGGTTLRDYRDSQGNRGYFARSLRVYGRQGDACDVCRQEIQMIRQAGRSTYFCTFCQIQKNLKNYR